jgi:hypothetical protein
VSGDCCACLPLYLKLAGFMRNDSPCAPAKDILSQMSKSLPMIVFVWRVLKFVSLRELRLIIHPLSISASDGTPYELRF